MTTNMVQNSQLVKTHSLSTRVGVLVLLFDSEGRRWTPASRLSEIIGFQPIEMARKLESHYWEAKHFSGVGFCVPVSKLQELLNSVRSKDVPSAYRGPLNWMLGHAHGILSKFQPRETQPVLIQEEPAEIKKVVYPVHVDQTPEPRAELVTLKNDEAVTTSLAIAQGTEVEHKAVIQLVRTYQSDLQEFGRVTFEMEPFVTAGGTQSREVALLNEQQATLLMTYMRNSDIVRKFKVRLVKAFYELLHRVPANPFLSMDQEQLLEFSLQQVKEKKALACKVEEQTVTISMLEPKAAGLDIIATKSEGAHTLTESAKILQIAPRKFVKELERIGWIYRTNGNNAAYQDKIRAGLMEHKFVNIQRTEGVLNIAQPLITAKGLTKLAEIFGMAS